MSMKKDAILLGHGSGGKMAAELVNDIFISRFGNPEAFPTDSALVEAGSNAFSFTTDSYVVDPIFFPGGNIGKLAVCGTINDLAVSGARPLALSCGFILEEGFPIAQLSEIVETMASESANAGVPIVAGDTKVVPRGKCDKIFINTSGFGLLPEDRKDIGSGTLCKSGDLILVNGFIGDHGTAIMAKRNAITFDPEVRTDCAALNTMIEDVLTKVRGVHFMRDATRGGLSTVLCELAVGRALGIELIENDVPLNPQVEGFCEMFGFDPLFMANEGKVVMVVAAADAEAVLSIMRNHPEGISSRIIGSISENHPSRVIMHTSVGGKRMIDMLAGEQLPRIC